MSTEARFETSACGHVGPLDHVCNRPAGHGGDHQLDEPGKALIGWAKNRKDDFDPYAIPLCDSCGSSACCATKDESPRVHRNGGWHYRKGYTDATEHIVKLIERVQNEYVESEAMTYAEVIAARASLHYLRTMIDSEADA